MSQQVEQDLALSLAAAVRTAAYYDPDNGVMRQSVALLVRLLSGRLRSESPMTIAVHSHCVFVQKARVRSTIATFPRFAQLVDLYGSWGIQTLSFFQGLTEEEAMHLLMVLAREKERSADILAASLRKTETVHIQVDLPESAGGAPHAKAASLEAYAGCLQIAKDMQSQPAATQEMSLRHLRHVTQAVVDQVLSDPHSLIALSTIKDFDDYLISHSTNVAILSVVLGQRLGLSKTQLGELCLAAFLHDTGKLEIEADILTQPRDLSEQEWHEMERHPALGTEVLLSQLRPGVSSMRAAVVAFEHHLRYDMAGYPKTWIKKEITLFGGIVSIADVYDAMTTARVYRTRNFTPYEALDYLIKNAGTCFDPVLVKLFAQMMGVYPLGTVVELTNGELAAVVRPPAPGGPLDRPQVRILQGEGSDLLIDLDERVSGVHVCSIKNVVNPSNRGLAPAVSVSLFADGQATKDVGCT
jgi:HD-GYP domain-containing protein (c-di-GMP phosphodiesterase class II)